MVRHHDQRIVAATRILDHEVVVKELPRRAETLVEPTNAFWLALATMT